MRLRGRARAALGDHEDGVERLQRIDGADDQRDHDEGQDQRQRDVAEHLPGVAPSISAAS